MSRAAGSASGTSARTARSFRLVTYNVHGCVGGDGRLSEERIAEVLADVAPDFVALQELDVGRRRSSLGHQPEKIARALSMDFLFCPSVRDGDEHYGHAVMSHLPLTHVKSEELPRVTWPRPAEPRSAIWSQVSTAYGPLQVIATHLGLSPIERGRQASALCGERWMNEPRFSGMRIFCGDLNAGPYSLTYRLLRRGLRDAHRTVAGFRARATYPARMPLLRLDHVFASRDLEIKRAWVVISARARAASDHLPLVVDFELPEGAT